MNDAIRHPRTRIALSRRKEVRRTIHNNEWWFAVADVVAALTDSANPHGYIKDMRRSDPQLAKEWGQIVTPLYIATRGGPQPLNCANAKGLFRLIQSIPSRRAASFKRRLAKVGYQRIQEIEDPELAAKRTSAIRKRDHMTDMEFIFSILEEVAISEIARNRDIQVFPRPDMTSVGTPLPPPHGNSGATCRGVRGRLRQPSLPTKIMYRQFQGG